MESGFVIGRADVGSFGIVSVRYLYTVPSLLGGIHLSTYAPELSHSALFPAVADAGWVHISSERCNDPRF